MDIASLYRMWHSLVCLLEQGASIYDEEVYALVDSIEDGFQQLPRGGTLPKRYLLFCGYTYYPSGGWSDFAGSYDSIEAAKGARHGDWHQVVDTLIGEVVDGPGEWLYTKNSAGEWIRHNGDTDTQIATEHPVESGTE